MNPEAAGEPKFDLSKYDDYNEGDGLTDAASYKKYKLEKKTSTKIDENTVTDHKVVKTTGKDGVITFTGLSEGTYHFVESGVPAGYNGIDPFDIKIEFSYTGDMDTGTGNFTSTSANVVEEDGTFVITVQNNKGVELPSTGGIGTTIFYVGGSVLVLAAAILLITKRRMGNND